VANLSFGEVALLAVLVALALWAGGGTALRRAAFAFAGGVRKGLRDDDPGIRVREVGERRADGTRPGGKA
jgi:hypothetical protein